MFRLVSYVLIQMVKPERILPRINFLQQTISEQCPFGFSNMTFKKRLLDSNAVILTGSRHSAQAFLPRFVGRGNIICD